MSFLKAPLRAKTLRITRSPEFWHQPKYVTIFFLIEKSEPQMGLEPTTLRDLVGCSNHWATGDSMVSEGQFVGLDYGSF